MAASPAPKPQGAGGLPTAGDSDEVMTTTPS